MAENLFSASEPVILSDEENVKPVRPTRTMFTSSSDSDSDTNGRPQLKKKRSTTIRRNVHRSRDTRPLTTMKMSTYSSSGSRKTSAPSGSGSGSIFKDVKSIFSSSVYSQAVSGSFPLRSHVVDPKITESLNEKNDDDEIEDIFSKNSGSKKQGRQASKRQMARDMGAGDVADCHTRKSRRKRSSSPKSTIIEDQGPEKIQEYEPKVIFLEDEETDVDDDGSDTENRGMNKSLSFSQTRDPTPPPTPPSDDGIGLQRPKRRKKAVKKAISQLERFKLDQEILMQEDEGSDDTDLSIIEVSTPSKRNERELTVKVRSRSGIQRFPMRMGQSFASVFQEMARHEFVNESQISMFLGDKRINSYDTPENLKLEVADIVDCYIRRLQDSDPESSDDDNDPNRLKLRVQGKDSKSQVTLHLGRDEPMEKLMREYAKQKNLDYNKLCFQFDGEDINPRDTPGALDLEDSFCVDVINS